MPGTTCTAAAPVPITATRRPVTSRSSGQWEEWNDRPAKSARPGRSGTKGRLSMPTPLTTVFAVTVKASPSPGWTRTVHRVRSGSYSAAVTSCPNRTCGVTPCSSAQRANVRLDLVAGRVVLRPLGVRRERVRVEEVGDVDPQTGVVVLPPGPADGRVLVEDRVADPQPAQPNRHGDPGEAGPDDRERGSRPARRPAAGPPTPADADRCRRSRTRPRSGARSRARRAHPRRTRRSGAAPRPTACAPVARRASTPAAKAGSPLRWRRPSGSGCAGGRDASRSQRSSSATSPVRCTSAERSTARLASSSAAARSIDRGLVTRRRTGPRSARRAARRRCWCRASRAP